MATYPAGEMTKELLYLTARIIFYRDGYNKASMKEVCSDAGIKQSVFYYHYKDKSEVAQILYSNFGKAHSTSVLEEIIKKKYTDDIIIANCVCSALLVINSIEDPKIGRFWAEMYADNLTANIRFHRHFHLNMYKKRYSQYDETDFEFFLINCSSINCGLMLSFVDGRLNTSAERVAQYKTEHTLRSLNYSESEIKEKTDMVLDIAGKIDIHTRENFGIELNGEPIF